MSKKILIIDDDPVVRMLLGECLKVHGHIVDSVDRGVAGIEWLNSNTPDLVFVDLIMPDMTGLDVIRKLRGDESKKGLPIILLSANSERNLGGNDPLSQPDRILEKPWDMEKLLKAIEEVTKR